MGSSYRLLDEMDVEVCDGLPVQNYMVDYNEMTKEYSLSVISDFKLPKKVYGDIKKKADRIINTFQERSMSTGVHFDGVKGSGKSMLAKYTSSIAASFGIPTIVVNKPYCGDEFNRFVQSIDGEAVIIFDEFEKVYDWGEQDKILTLFDGVFPSKKLFILTTNNSGRVSEFLKNRPGRIYYSFSFIS